MRCMLVTSEEKGHVNPLMGVAQELLARGHHVGWAALPEPPEWFESMGIDGLSLGAPPDGDGIPTGGPELAALVRDDERLLRWIKALLIDDVPALIPPMRELMHRWEPDLLVPDPMMYAAILASHLEGIPFACVSTSLNPVTPSDLDCRHSRNMQALSAPRRELFQDYGFDARFRVADCLSPYLNIVFATSEYVGADAPVPPKTYLVGPSMPRSSRGDEVDFPWSRLDGRPLVYASFGSQISHQPVAFEKLAEATRSLDLQLVMSCGELANSEWARDLPNHVITRTYVPQLRLLEHVDLLVTHGGANSVMEALTAGVPVLINPVCNDQDMQAYFVERRGVGRVINLEDMDLTEIEEIVEDMLRSAVPERRAVAEVQESYRAQNGAERAVTHIEDLWESWRAPS